MENIKYRSLEELEQTTVCAKHIDTIEGLSEFIKENNTYEIFEIRQELSNTIVEIREPLGKFIYEENDSWVGIDNEDGDVWINTEGCKNKVILQRWLLGEMDGEDVYYYNNRADKLAKLKEKYKEGYTPNYFTINKDHQVKNDLLKVDFEYEVLKYFNEKNKFRTIYWDFMDKYLALCGCENINFETINNNSQFINFHSVMELTEDKKEGILSVYFEDEVYSDTIDDDKYSIRKEFLLKLKSQINNNLIFEINEIKYC